jgi:hypothetical protein
MTLATTYPRISLSCLWLFFFFFVLSSFFRSFFALWYSPRLSRLLLPRSSPAVVALVALGDTLKETS